MIVLIGPMGAGKTTVGSLVAARLGTTLRDTDQDVERLGPATKRAAKLFADRLKDPRRVRDALDRLIPDVPGNGIAHADVIIEAIFEDVAAKRALFADAVDRARSEIVDAGYLTGLDAFRRRNYDVAVTELRRGLAYQAEGARAAEMRYHLGVALYKKGDPEEAASVLSLALAGRVEAAGFTDTRFYLAAALEQLGRYAEARTEYDRFVTEFPQSPLAPAARQKSVQLARVAVPRN